MLRNILIAIGVLVGVVAAYWLISPLFIEERVSERLEDISSTSSPQAPTPEILRQGTFVSLAGHSAEGTATLVKAEDRYYVRLEDDFRVTNGPDLFVHFGRNGEYSAEARLGALKGNVGGQNYEVPAEIDPSNYDEVWVWCRAFAVPFGKAVLH